MYVRNCLNPGDHLTVLPLGLNVTLQYNSNGILEKIHSGYGDLKKSLSLDITQTFRNNATAPVSISILGGTTYVFGVLYTSGVYQTEGSLPESVENNLVSAYLDNPNRFNFFAATVDSNATQFKGASPIRNWLNMSKFHVLPGYIVPSDLTRERFIKMVNTDSFPFKFPLISGYIVHRNDKVSYVSTELRQYIVKCVSRYIDAYGNLKAKISFKSDCEDIFVDYSQVVKYNIHTNTLLVMDKYNNVIYAETTDSKKRDKRSTNVTCQICGNTFKIDPNSGEDIRCTDVHCMSNQLPNINHFLSYFKLPTISAEDYFGYFISSKTQMFFRFSDIASYLKSQDITIETTPHDLLEAMVPVGCTDKASISSFTNQCNNNIQNIIYYIQHPDRMASFIRLDGRYGKNLMEWLSDKENVIDICKIVNSDILSFVETNKKFEGAPIFRGKKILITGNFLHGSTSDIIAILKSYSAEVYTEWVDGIQCVITGGTMEEMNGSAIRKARDIRIPIYDEVSFFNLYEIDKDLKENL